MGTGHQHELLGGGWVQPGLCFHPGDNLSSGSTAGAPRWCWCPAALSRACCEYCVSFAASHAWGRAGLPGEDGNAAVRAGTASPGARPAAPASPGGASASGPRRQHRIKMFPRGPFQLLCKLLTGKESDFSGSSPSKHLLPSLSQSGQCGCNVPEPFALMLLWMLEELSSAQGSGSRVLSTSGCSGLWGAGANAVARTRGVPGPQTHSWLPFFPSGLPMALFLVIWLPGSLHSLTLLREEWLWLCSGCSSSAPPSATLHWALGLLPAFLQLQLLG